jgi:CxxC motif-containing protein (DUF1111 family)
MFGDPRLQLKTAGAINVDGGRAMTDCISRRDLLIGCLVLGTLCFSAVRFVRAWSYWASDETLLTGRKLFEHEWQRNDPLSTQGDGLGPVFNARSCVECHFQGGVGGGGPNEKNVLAFEVLPNRRDRTVRNGVVHASAIDRLFQETQASVQRIFPIVPGGTRIVSGCTVKVADFDPVRYATINTPPLFGLALLEREVSDWTLVRKGAARSWDQFSRELSADFSATPVGRLRVLPGNRTGRFGWKGQFATLEEFVAAACAVELGLSNPIRHQDLAQHHVPDPNAGLDLDKKQLRALVAFVASLPRPVQVLPSDPQAASAVRNGEALFASIGCADCHTPDLGSVTGVYSDLRLYSLDPPEDSTYATSVPEVPLPASEPKLSEWKTPPLWGVADSAPYFHDGASPTLEEAILRHQGDAKKSSANFVGLSPVEKQSLIGFLKTLRAPQFAIAK